MSFSFSGNLVQVGTTPDVLIRFKPRDLSSVMMRATGALTIGNPGLTVTKGLRFIEGAPFGFSHQDFSPEMLKENAEVVIYAVAAVATTAEVALISR